MSAATTYVLAIDQGTTSTPNAGGQTGWWSWGTPCPAMIRR